MDVGKILKLPILVEVAPWYNKEEFEKVYQYAYDIDVTKKRWAVDQISLWQTRVHPSIPTGIEATAALVRAVIQDVLLNNNATLCKHSEIIMMYGMALVRFVNLICELDQTSNQKISTDKIARKHGIPSWVVTLRHDATHSNYPSLTMLRSGTQVALNWLNENYWRKELESFTDYEKLPMSPETEVINAVADFQEVRYELLYLISNHSQKKRAALKVEQARALTCIKILMKKYRKKFAEIIMRPGLFIPTIQILEALLNESEKSFLADESLELPESLAKFWTPVLRLAQQLCLVQDFIVSLMRNQKSGRSAMYEKFVVSWALKILKTATFNGMLQSMNPQSSKLFGREKIYFYWLQILNACFMNPCKYSPALLPLITTHLNLDEAQVSKLMYLVAIRLGGALPSPLADGNVNSQDPTNVVQRMFTVEKLKKARVLEGTARRVQSSNKMEPKEPWQLEDTIDFSRIPLGAILGDEVDVSECKSQEEVIAVEEESSTMSRPNCHMSENEKPERYIRNNEDNIQLEDCTFNIGHSHRNVTIEEMGNCVYYKPLNL